MKFSVWVLFATAVLNHAFCRTYADDVIDNVTTTELVVEYNATGSDFDDATVFNSTSEYKDLNETEEECGVCTEKPAFVCQDGQLVLVTPAEDILGRVLTFVVYIGFSISLVACIVANIIYIITGKKLRQSPYHIHWNLIASFTLYHVVFLIDFSVLPECYITNVHVRNFLKVLLVYTVLANFFWMLVEGLILFFIIVKSFFDRQEGKDFIKWCVLGWGTPALLVIIWIVIEKFTMTGNCVVQLELSGLIFFGCVVVPVFILLLINGIVLVVVIRNIRLKLEADNMNKRLQNRSHRRTAKSTFVLLILLGTYYALPIIVAFIGQPCLLVKVVGFIGTTVSSVQGLAVSTLYVFRNGEIKRVLSSRYSQWGPVTMVTGTTPVSSSQTSSKRNSSSSGSEGSKHHRLHQQTTTNLEMKIRVPVEDINSNAADVLLTDDPNTTVRDKSP